jgi:hypothetical protein
LATSVRTLIKLIIGLFVVLPGAATWSRAEEARPVASTPTETLTMSAFIARIRQDAVLRARFARSPRAVLHEFGIDTLPINLPDQLTDAQLQRFLSDWTAGVDPVVPPPGMLISPPAPVYGPPPTPRQP